MERITHVNIRVGSESRLASFHLRFCDDLGGLDQALIRAPISVFSIAIIAGFRGLLLAIAAGGPLLAAPTRCAGNTRAGASGHA